MQHGNGVATLVTSPVRLLLLLLLLLLLSSLPLRSPGVAHVRFR